MQAGQRRGCVKKQQQRPVSSTAATAKPRTDVGGHLLGNLRDFGNLLLFGGVENDDGGSDDAQGAPDLAQGQQLLVQDAVRKDRAAQPVLPRSGVCSAGQYAREAPGGAHLISTLNAPNGVTRMAGAKAYAAKLATSPPITARPAQPVGSSGWEGRLLLPCAHFLLVIMPTHHRDSRR